MADRIMDDIAEGMRRREKTEALGAATSDLAEALAVPPEIPITEEPDLQEQLAKLQKRADDLADLIDVLERVSRFKPKKAARLTADAFQYFNLRTDNFPWGHLHWRDFLTEHGTLPLQTPLPEVTANRGGISFTGGPYLAAAAGWSTPSDHEFAFIGSPLTKKERKAAKKKRKHWENGAGAQPLEWDAVDEDGEPEVDDSEYTVSMGRETFTQSQWEMIQKYVDGRISHALNERDGGL